MNQNNSEPRISFSTIVLSILALALTLIPVSIVLAEDNKEDLPIADLEFKRLWCRMHFASFRKRLMSILLLPPVPEKTGNRLSKEHYC